MEVEAEVAAEVGVMQRSGAERGGALFQLKLPRRQDTKSKLRHVRPTHGHGHRHRHQDRKQDRKRDGKRHETNLDLNPSRLRL